MYITVTMNLNSEVPVGGGPYVITVVGRDSCDHTASTTVTISTYNSVSISQKRFTIYINLTIAKNKNMKRITSGYTY